MKMERNRKLSNNIIIKQVQTVAEGRWKKVISANATAQFEWIRSAENNILVLQGLLKEDNNWI